MLLAATHAHLLSAQLLLKKYCKHLYSLSLVLFWNSLWCSVFQIAAICQEAGMHAVRKNRYVILPKDFEKGYRTNVKKPETDFDFYKWGNILLNCMLVPLRSYH